MYALINARFYDYKDYRENVSIIFDDHIRIIKPMSEYKNHGYMEVDCTGKLVMPGFVSGHTHLYSTFARGMAIEFNPKDFLDILKQLWWKMDHFLDLDLVYHSAFMGALEQLSSGTTTLIDHHASGSIRGSLHMIKKAVVDELGIRAILAFETSDRFNVSSAIEENLDFIEHNHQKNSDGLFGMHASLSLSDDTLTKISGKLNGAGIHVHVAESMLDEEDCLTKYGMRVVERLERFKLLNEKSLLVHCTHIDETEMDIIKKHGSTIAVNVTSNLNNAVGISQIKKFLDKGIRVISGNDGLLPSQPIEYLNIYYLSHLLGKSPVAFSLNDLRTIINNTYEYANEIFKTNLGCIKEGAETDLVIIDFNPYTPVTKDNIFSHVFFGAFPNFRPEKVIAGGKILIENYKTKENYQEKFSLAIAQSERLWKIIGKEGKDVRFKY
ncbi:MAG: amidohydrolase family protein [Candidatus Izemoplasmatales bacterium]|nr:amidohydrolase family protein [Candidatus Izemoplasmatales bacterium]